MLKDEVGFVAVADADLISSNAPCACWSALIALQQLLDLGVFHFLEIIRSLYSTLTLLWRHRKHPRLRSTMVAFACQLDVEATGIEVN